MLSQLSFIHGCLSMYSGQPQNPFLPRVPVLIWPKEMTLLRMVDPSESFLMASVPSVDTSTEGLCNGLRTLVAMASSAQDAFPNRIVVGLGFTLSSPDEPDSYTMHFVHGPRDGALQVWDAALEQSRKVNGIGQQAASSAPSESSGARSGAQRKEKETH